MGMDTTRNAIPLFTDIEVCGRYEPPAHAD
jgi:hypothetical protein